MLAGGRIVTRHWPDDDAHRRRILTERDDIVAEREVAADGDQLARFAQRHGPFRHYERTVRTTSPATSAGGGELVEQTSYRLVVPWFGLLFRWPVGRVIARRGSYRAWWAPPDRLDVTQIRVIGLIAAASMSAAFVNTLFTQTVNFAADDLGVGDDAIGFAGASVRAGVVIALPAAILADRIGRRRVMITVAWLAPLLSLLGALAPDFVTLTATQTVARPMGLALHFVIGVVAAEEMPRNSRAYAISVLAMASGLGAGIAVMSLGLADLGDGGWRLVYLVSAIWLVVAVDLTRRLPETRRFVADAARRTGLVTADATASVAAHTDTTAGATDATGSGVSGVSDVAPRPADTTAEDVAEAVTSAGRSDRRLDRRRFWLLASVAFAGNVFIAPASFFQNNYLTDVRGFDGGDIALFSILVGTPAGLGLVIGGRLADRMGRRPLISVGLPLSVTAIVVAFSVGGPGLWAFSFLGGFLGSAVYPAMQVYRTELFPTANRARASGFVIAAALLGGIGGLVITGQLVDRGWSYSLVMGLLAVGQLVATVLVVLGYPETAHRELEDINPEDEVLDLGTLESR